MTQQFPVLKPTELRTDPNYSIYFNWFRFVAIGVIPFGLLVLFNAKIYSDIKVKHVISFSSISYCRISEIAFSFKNVTSIQYSI